MHFETRRGIESFRQRHPWWGGVLPPLNMSHFNPNKSFIISLLYFLSCTTLQWFSPWFFPKWILNHCHSFPTASHLCNASSFELLHLVIPCFNPNLLLNTSPHFSNFNHLSDSIADNVFLALQHKREISAIAGGCLVRLQSMSVLQLPASIVLLKRENSSQRRALLSHAVSLPREESENRKAHSASC